MSREQIARLLQLFVIAAFIAGGCRASQPRQLPFESFDSSVDDLGYRATEPALTVVVSLEDVDRLALERSNSSHAEEVGDLLRAVDYDEMIAVIVFRGEAPSTTHTYIPEITDVLRDGNRIILRSHFGAPGLDDLIGFEASFPWHIITISKAGQWDRVMRFVLEVDGEKVTEVKHYVP